MQGVIKIRASFGTVPPDDRAGKPGLFGFCPHPPGMACAHIWCIGTINVHQARGERTPLRSARVSRSRCPRSGIVPNGETSIKRSPVDEDLQAPGLPLGRFSSTLKFPTGMSANIGTDHPPSSLLTRETDLLPFSRPDTYSSVIGETDAIQGSSRLPIFSRT